MIAEQELKEVSISQEIHELKREFKEYKDKYTSEQLKDLIERIKPLVIDNVETELYRYCKEYHPELVRTTKDFKNRLLKKDSHICVEGETGSGKSTLTLTLVCIMLYYTKQKLNFNRHVLFIPKEKELSMRLDKLNEYDTLWVDESIKSLNKKKHFQADVIESNETVQTERFRHNTVFYCIPTFNELTKSFRDVNIKFRVWCVNTECAIIRVKEIDPDICTTYGAWYTDWRARAKTNKQINTLTDIDTRLAVERSLPGHIRAFTWPDLESIEKFSALHLLYEVNKKYSRTYLKEHAIPKDEKSETYHKSKQRITIIEIMANQIKRNPDLKFKEWYKNAGDLSLTTSTLRSYWCLARDKCRKENVI